MNWAKVKSGYLQEARIQVELHSFTFITIYLYSLGKWTTRRVLWSMDKDGRFYVLSVLEGLKRSSNKNKKSGVPYVFQQAKTLVELHSLAFITI
jgi:hypothetical protein